MFFFSIVDVQVVLDMFFVDVILRVFFVIFCLRYI